LVVVASYFYPQKLKKKNGKIEIQKYFAHHIRKEILMIEKISQTLAITRTGKAALGGYRP